MFKILFTLFAKQATLLRRSTVVSLPPQLVFPGFNFFSMSLTVLQNKLERLSVSFFQVSLIFLC
jgi:hypothetical protein